ncbi:PREDICTED: proteasome subunit beta type-3-like [Elephantulus edwardii]|uniref:proteasome subunit beta type-3-like n=1 Tax=Elephantulus edwardii TaxID=28737 RepID=UPI0003F0B85A|nr:PREDICTED: proteasome subunit beta type-3-like [Elephantulus edwardii]
MKIRSVRAVSHTDICKGHLFNLVDEMHLIEILYDKEDMFTRVFKTVAQRLKFRLNLYELKEGRQIKPYTLMSMVTNLLYEKRFGPYYTEPVIAGLDPKTFKPFICSLDLIGCPMVTDDFVVSGTCAEQMYGMCESLWEPNMDPDHLFETISQAMLNAVDRDAVSGMGVIVHIIEKDKITTRTLKARMD